MTRGWPLAPRPGERVDHPHHVGLWFNYESVNSLDFWNNSDDIKPANRSKMGTIPSTHRVGEGGSDRGELMTESDWVTSTGTVLLHERTQSCLPATRARGPSSDRDADSGRTRGVRRREGRHARPARSAAARAAVERAAGLHRRRGTSDRSSQAGQHGRHRRIHAARARRATRCGRRALVGRCWPAISARSRSRSP